MKLRSLIKKLENLEQKHGDLDVLLVAHATDVPCELASVILQVAEEGDYPKEYDMPAGFKFVQLYT
jgi:hypothetical protein